MATPSAEDVATGRANYDGHEAWAALTDPAAPGFDPKATYNFVNGDAGNNFLEPSTMGADVYRGGDGDDLYASGEGDDHSFGQNGKDLLNGGDGNDHLYGGADYDLLYGNPGDDWLYGDGGHDNLSGEAGNDHLYGGDGDDFLYGQDGNDHLEGGAGQNWYHPGDGNDTMVAGSGDDTFVLDLDGGHDRIKNYDHAHNDLIVYGKLPSDYHYTTTAEGTLVTWGDPKGDVLLLGVSGGDPFG